MGLIGLINENLVIMLTGWTVALLGAEFFEIGEGFVSIKNPTTGGSVLAGKTKAAWTISLSFIISATITIAAKEFWIWAVSIFYLYQVVGLLIGTSVFVVVVKTGWKHRDWRVIMAYLICILTVLYPIARQDFLNVFLLVGL